MATDMGTPITRITANIPTEKQYQNEYSPLGFRSHFLFWLCWREGQTVTSAPDENHFTVSQTGETGLVSSPFRCQKGNSVILVFLLVSILAFEPVQGRAQTSSTGMLDKGGAVYNATAYSVKADAVILTDGTMSAGSPSLASSTACTSADVGKLLDVQYAGNLYASNIGINNVGNLATTVASCSGTAFVLTVPAVTTTTGQILSAAPGAGGSGYSINDTGTINGSCVGATYRVLGVSGGAVANFAITVPGSGCVVANGTATTVATGGGNGLFTVNILGVSAGARVVYGTDQTSHIASFFAAVPSGSTCFFPDGNYAIGGTFALDGSTTKCTKFSGNTIGAATLYLIGPMLQSNGSVSPTTNMFNVTAGGYRMDGLGLSGTNWVGIAQALGAESNGVIVNAVTTNCGKWINSSFNSFWGIGWHAGGAGQSNCELTGDTFAYNAKDGANMNASNSIFSNNVLHDNGSAGNESVGSYNSFTGNSCYTNKGACVAIGGSYTTSSRHNVVSGNIADNNFIGITLNQGAQDNLISNNDASLNGVGIQLIDSGAILSSLSMVADASTTSGSDVVSCPNSDCNFIAGMVGYDIVLVGTGSAGRGATRTNQYCSIRVYTNAAQISVSCKAAVTQTGSATIYYPAVVGGIVTIGYINQRNTISNNNVYSNGCSNAGMSCVGNHNGTTGIYVYSNNNVIKNNYVTDEGIPGFSQVFGILEEVGVDGTTYYGNNSRDNGTADYYFHNGTNAYFQDPLAGFTNVTTHTETFAGTTDGAK